MTSPGGGEAESAGGPNQSTLDKNIETTNPRSGSPNRTQCTGSHSAGLAFCRICKPELWQELVRRELPGLRARLALSLAGEEHYLEVATLAGGDKPSGSTS